MNKVPIDSIYVGTRLRGADPAQVAALADSIAEVGLICPITVCRGRIMQANMMVDGWHIVAGLHRYEACKSLGMTDIAVHVVELSDLHQQLAEVDENLCGTRLTASERATFTARRKQIYEALHPETRHGGDRASRQVGNLKDDRFTADTAAKTGNRNESFNVTQREARKFPTRQWPRLKAQP